MLAESLRGVIAQTLFKRIDTKGRIAAFEVLKNTSAVANLIREAKTFQIPSAMQTAGDAGMITFDNYIRRLMQQGLIDPVEGQNFLGLKPQDKSSVASVHNVNQGRPLKKI
jgi:twitching motility protein PilT